MGSRLVISSLVTGALFRRGPFVLKPSVDGLCFPVAGKIGIRSVGGDKELDKHSEPLGQCCARLQRRMFISVKE